MRTLNTDKGFTLIELCFVILISGIVMLAISMASAVYISSLRQEKITTLMTAAKDAIETFQAEEDVYPCPANPALAVGQANYGVADCTLTPVNGVLIGLFPIRSATLGTNTNPNLASHISKTDTLTTNFVDPWGNQLFYAVTQDLTSDSTFDSKLGKVRVIDENNQRTGGTQKYDAHFVVFSRGADTRCTAGTLDFENCNNDHIFRYGLQSNADGAAHYDDYLALGLWIKEKTWSVHKDASGNAKNDNTGSLGIGTSAPTQKVDVIGNTAITGNTMVPKICDDGTANCLNSGSIYNVGCHDGSYVTNPNPNYLVGMQNIGNNVEEYCQELKITPLKTRDCKTKGGVRGIYTDGNIVCGDD